MLRGSKKEAPKHSEHESDDEPPIKRLEGCRKRSEFVPQPFLAVDGRRGGDIAVSLFARRYVVTVEALVKVLDLDLHHV